MLNHEGSHHEHFEELCALAASGQISEPEFLELQDHLKECAPCQSAYADFVDLLHCKLPLADPELLGSSKLPHFFSKDSSYRDRFIARARKEGLAVSRRENRESLGPWWLRLGYPRLATLIIVVLLLAVGYLGYGLHQTNVRYSRLADEKAQMSTWPSPPNRLGSISPQESHRPSLQPVDASRQQAATLPQPPKTDAELNKARTDRDAAEARSKALEGRLTEFATELEALRTQNEETGAQRQQLQKKLQEAEQAANAIKGELQDIRQARSKDSLTISTQDLEIQKLSERISEQAETLEQEKALLEASREVRDLMGARNFHIADVSDVDSKGKDQRAYGRIFMTEKKSTLIFYAFDLNDRNTARRNASFQVWGKRGPAQGPTHSLGLFQIDDQKLNRWVLRFEDPQVLAEIDSVFVTVEPAGGSAKPTGRQFLYSYLNTTPNRP